MKKEWKQGKKKGCEEARKNGRKVEESKQRWKQGRKQGSKEGIKQGRMERKNGREEEWDK